MLPLIKRILYATDLSENARFAFNYAISLANTYNAKITVVHVMPELTSSAMVMVTDIMGSERWEELRKKNEENAVLKIRNRIKDFCSNTGNKIPECPFIVDDIVIETGHPVDEIIRISEKINCDILIMGSRGQGILTAAMLGSTSQRVLRRCKKPVLTIRLPE